MDDLDNRLKQLPREMHPRVDLWPNIATRLQPPQQRWSLQQVAAIAAVFFLAAVLLRVGSDVPESGFDGGNLEVLSASVELEYSGALRDLRDSIYIAPAQTGDGALVAYQQGLQQVYQATRQVRAALQQDPQSRLLSDMLADLQKKQLGVMRDIALLSETQRGSAT